MRRDFFPQQGAGHGPGRDRRAEAEDGGGEAGEPQSAAGPVGWPQAGAQIRARGRPGGLVRWRRGAEFQT